MEFAASKLIAGLISITKETVLVVVVLQIRGNLCLGTRNGGKVEVKVEAKVRKARAVVGDGQRKTSGAVLTLCIVLKRDCLCL